MSSSTLPPAAAREPRPATLVTLEDGSVIVFRATFRAAS
jgi:hypothetical protein